MPVETFNYIDSLVTTNPTATDNVSEGDDHIRGIKTTLKNTFPNVNGAVNATDEELNYVDGVTSAIQTQIDGKQATLGAGDITATEIASNAVGADELNVTGNGTAGQYLASDGDGTMTWTTLSSDPTMGGDLSGTASNAQIVADSVGASELNVTGNGTSGQMLTSDADGSFTWVDAPGGNPDTVFIGTGTVTAAGNRFLVSAIGGGGGGTGGIGGNGRPAGGGGAKCSYGLFSCVDGETITFTRGNGGNGGGWATSGNDGNATTISGSSSGTIATFGGGQATNSGNACDEGQGGTYSSTKKIDGWTSNGSIATLGCDCGATPGAGQTFGYSEYGRGGNGGCSSGGAGQSGMVLLHGFTTS